MIIDWGDWATQARLSPPGVGDVTPALETNSDITALEGFEGDPVPDGTWELIIVSEVDQFIPLDPGV